MSASKNTTFKFYMCAFIYICMYVLYEYIWIKLRENMILISQSVFSFLRQMTKESQFRISSDPILLESCDIKNL